MMPWQREFREWIVDQFPALNSMGEAAGIKIRDVARYLEAVAIEAGPKLRAEGFDPAEGAAELWAAERAANLTKRAFWIVAASQLANPIRYLEGMERQLAEITSEPIIYAAMKRNAHHCALVAEALGSN